MSVNGITSKVAYDYQASQTSYEKKADTSATKAEQAVVYEKSSESGTKKTSYKVDTQTIEKLKAEAEQRTKQLRDVVEQMLIKQGKTLTLSDDIYQMLREGNLEVPSDVQKQAQEDISEDGYFGIKQTSDRLVSFAQALSGGDPSKADEMIKAVQKGFEQATKSWGDELPDICKKTLDETIRKLEEWRDGLEVTE